MIGNPNQLPLVRKRSGLTQTRLANMLGISQANVVRIEQAPGTASLNQALDWLKYCGMIANPNGPFLKSIQAHKIDPVHSFLTGMDEVLRSSGVRSMLHVKPRAVVYSNTAEDQQISNAFIRGLLNNGDGLFAGFLQPTSDITIIFKHVGERPSRLDQTVYVWPGPLNLGALASLPDNPEDAHDFGNFSCLDEVPQNSIGVVYLDHPILRFVDIIRPGVRAASVQSFFDFQASISADLVVACCGSKPSPSPALMMVACLLSRSVDFLVCPAVVDPRRIEDILNEVSGRSPTRFILDDYSRLELGNKDAFTELVKTVSNIDTAYCASQRSALDHRQLIVRHMAPVTKPFLGDAIKSKTSLGTFIVDRLTQAYRDEASGLRRTFSAFELLTTFDESYKTGINWELPQNKYDDAVMRRTRLGMVDVWDKIMEDGAKHPELLDEEVVELIYLAWQNVRRRVVEG